MKSNDEQRRIVAYLDGLPPSLRFGDLRQAKVNALRGLQVKSGEELSPPVHFGDGSQSALMPSVLDRAFKGELC
jgi:hypothetical protein